MNPIGIIHTGFGFSSLILGAVVLLSKKGTRLHKSFGWMYVISMLSLNITAFGIYRITGMFNMFHFFAIVTLGLVMVGLFAPLYMRKQGKNWLGTHSQYMAWSYAGLGGATINEIFVHVPVINRVIELGFWSWFIVYGIQIIYFFICYKLIHVNLNVTTKKMIKNNREEN